jgi:hypothetical protein
MTEHPKEELSVLSCLEKLVRRKPTERESAMDKRASVKDEFLPPLVALFSYEVDGLDFSEPLFRNIDFRKK